MKKQLTLINIIAISSVVFLKIINAETVNLDASITIKSNLTLQTQQTLSFGEITKPNQEIMVRLQEDDSLIDDTNNIILNANASAGKYKITGQPNTNINISVESVGVLASDIGSVNATYSVNNPPTILNSSGEAIIVVLGAVRIPSTMPIGVYNGVFKLTYSY